MMYKKVVSYQKNELYSDLKLFLLLCPQDITIKTNTDNIIIILLSQELGSIGSMQSREIGQMLAKKIYTKRTLFLFSLLTNKVA
jgi:hypothetical protein